MSRSWRQFLSGVGLFEASASISAWALVNPWPKVRKTMTSAFELPLRNSWLNQRGVVVAAGGIVFGALLQASFVEGSRGRLQSEFIANHATIAGAQRISTRMSIEPGEGCPGATARPLRPPVIAPKPRAEIAQN